mmetsp:Transcript_52229/g.167418  ORF Transcript_52229/g.167418 Transcript_52229/m.167418 type:complete len:784 (+) Transcript_52229:78-2429(+)
MASPAGEAAALWGTVSQKSLTDAEVKAAIDAPSSKSGEAKGKALLAASDAYLIKEDPVEAVRVAREALAIFRGEKAAKGMDAAALVMLAKAQIAGSTYLEALQAANQAVKIFKDQANKNGEACALHTVAQAHLAKQSPEDAVWKATEALKIFKSLKDTIGEGAALETTAKCYALSGDFKKGMPAAKDALKIASGNALAEGYRMCLISSMLVAQDELDEAVQSAKDALAKAHDLGDKALELAALDAIVAAYMKKGDYDDAVNAIQLELDRFRRQDEKKEEAAALTKMAEVYLANKEPDQGLGPIRDAVNIYRSLADKKGEANAMCVHAQILLADQDAADALRVAEGAISLFKELGKKGIAGYLAAFEVLINANVMLGSAEDAFSTAVDTLKTFNAAREKKGEASVLMTIADLQMGRRDFDGALSTLEQAPALFLAVGEKSGEAAAWVKIANLRFMKNEPGLALRAAEEALTAYRKFGDKAGKAMASQLVAEAHFSLVPFGQGNAREAMRAAQDAASIYQGLSDKNAEAVALHVLANAQLMAHANQDAQKTARKAEQLFQELGDSRGQAAAMLLVSGSYLGEGDYQEAKDAAKDARDLFRAVGDSAGEDSVEDFLDTLKQYEAGQLNRSDFMGFSMKGPAEAAGPAPRRRLKDKQVDTALSTIELIAPAGPKGEKFTMVYFDGFESRQAKAPGQRVGSRSASAAASEEALIKPEPQKEGVVYSVRWVAARGKGEKSEDTKPKEPQKVEDRRINVSLSLGQPKKEMAGHCGPTDRMFYAMGKQKGV